ncbi:MAG: hypothetical protein JF616_06245 [Fibrobacteres bacterium]|nr:hypothetical protein [Fibrobacterota bacterium]
MLIGIGSIAPMANAAGPNALSAAADSCGPSYLDIYDFQVGDVFQYSRSRWDAGGGNGQYAGDDRKYTILSKDAHPDGYRYQVRGLIRSWSFTPANNQQFGSFNGTWLFTDSLAKPSLNACEDQVAKMLYGSFPPGPPRATGYYTRVHIAIGDTFDIRFLTDTTRLKYFGAPITSQYPNNNLYVDSAGNILLGEQGPIENGPLTYLEVYAAGLGIVHSENAEFESSPKMSMTGYIRNGVTHGKVESDSAFGVTVAIRAPSPEGMTHPDPYRPSEIDPFLFSAGKSGLRDPLGRRAQSFPIRSSYKVASFR